MVLESSLAGAPCYNSSMSNYAERVRQALGEYGATSAEWAILVTTGYNIPYARKKFAWQAAWEARTGCPPTDGDVTEDQAECAIDSCVAKDWIRLTEPGHIERHRDIFGHHDGNTTMYPRDGIVLTELGHQVLSRIAISIHGREYYARP